MSDDLNEHGFDFMLGRRLLLAVGTIILGSLILAFIDLVNLRLLVGLAFFLGVAITSINYIAIINYSGWQSITWRSDLILWAVTLLTGLGGTGLFAIACWGISSVEFLRTLTTLSRCINTDLRLIMFANLAPLWIHPFTIWLFVRIRHIRAKQQMYQ